MPKPKVISVFKTDKFENRFLNISMMGKPVDIFLECKSYDLELPIKGKTKRELDIFEETILRMVLLKKCPIPELAETLCLKKDLVNFIILRMIESGLLEDNQTVSAKGRKLLDVQSQIREEIETVQGKMFVIKKTGLILPYIHIGEFQSEAVDDFDPNSITIGFGTVGNYRRIYGKCVRDTDFERRVDSVLDTRIVKKAIKTFNKIASAQNRLTIQLSEEYGIYSSASENIYFHLQAVVQEGNVDEVMFSDGFVPNIDGIADYIRNEDPELLSSIKSRTVDMTVSSDEDQVVTYRSQRYREIYHHYENACKHLPDIQYEQATIDERTDINEGKRQIIIDCYYMIEWAFYYYTRRNPLSEEMINLIKQRPFSANAKTLTRFAHDMGFQYTNMCSNLFSHIDGNKIDGVYNYNSPKLYVCLPLAIAEAKENSSSEIHLLIQKDRGVLRFINFLNDNCGDLRHDSEADAIDMDTVEILDETKRIITTILPDLSFAKDEKIVVNHRDSSRARLLAQVSLEKKLGSIFFSTMRVGLKNDWLKISPDKKGNQLPDAREYIEIIYRILQAELSEANKDLNGKGKRSKSDALTILSERYTGRIPKSFSNINDIYYYNAAKEEGNSTLGAEALVFIANVDNPVAEKLNNLNYVQMLDRVISLRGHGNMVALNETEQSLNNLRDDVIKLTRVIGGYYD